MSSAEAVLRVSLICLAFFSLHSVMVAEWFKSLAMRAVGPRIMGGFYRLAFTLISIAGLIACIWLILDVPDRHIYSFPGWLAWPMHAVQLAGLFFGYMSYRQLRSGEFTGTEQALRHMRGQEPSGDIEGLTEQTLIRTGGYGVVRNPLYSAGIMIFAFEPYLTRTWLTVSVLSIMYFIWGAWIEQRRMLGRFGNMYRAYMGEVPLLIPRPGALLRWMRDLK